VADQIRLVEQLRVGISCFSSAPLPDSGMTLDYLKIDADDSAAAEQVHEGDELVQSKVSLTHASADIKTYGSWASMSLQAVQRSPVSVVDLTYQAMVRQVAKTTDLAFLTALAAAAAGTPVVRAADTATGWADGIIEAELQLATLGLGLPAEGILTNLVDFGKLAKLRIGEFPVVIGPGVRTLQAMGSVDPVNAYAAGARGFFNGLPIFVDPNLADHVTYVYNSAAMCVYGNPAPIRLSGDWDSSTVKTLTSAFSVYLMTAIAAPWPAAIVAVTPHA
jgi:HK97 family phage major capsid protein